MFFSSVQKVPANMGMALAAVTMTENGIRLIYDVKFMSEAKKEDIDFVLSHELMHVLGYHFTRGFELMSEFNLGQQEFFSKYAPYADLPVNNALQNMEGYKNHASKLLSYAKTGELSYDSHPTFESIVRWLRTHPAKEKQIMSALGIGTGQGPTVVQVDENGNVTVICPGASDNVVVVPQVTQEGKREYLRDVAEIVKSAHRSAGNIPYEMSRSIQQFLDQYGTDVLKGWALLEQLLVGERSINKGYIRCYGRMNRRTRMIPGKRRIKGFSAMMIVDESGSMSDEEVNIAFAFAKKIVLRENNDKLYLVHWDTEPTNELEELKHESDIDELTRKRCGGTEFTQFFTHEIFHRHDYDLYICITDGFPCGWPVAEADKPVVWIITQSGGFSQWQSDYNKGLAVDISDEHNSASD